MNSVVLLAVLASYSLSLHEDVSGYVAVAGSEFDELQNPLGQFGVRYSLRASDGRSLALFYDHLSSLRMGDDSTGLNRIGVLYRHRLGNWEFFSSAGVRDRHFDYDQLRKHNALFVEAGVERKLGAWQQFDLSFFASGLYGGETYFHSGLRVSY